MTNDKMTPLQKIVYQAIKDAGADGLCDNDECGCGLDDFAPCEDGPYSDCQLARKLTVPASDKYVPLK